METKIVKQMIEASVFNPEGKEREDLSELLENSGVKENVKRIENSIFSLVTGEKATPTELVKINQMTTPSARNLLAVYSLVNTPLQPRLEEYEPIKYGQRSKDDKHQSGSYFELNPSAIKSRLLQAEYEVAEVVPTKGKIVFKTNDLTGYYGMAPLDELLEGTQLYGFNLKYVPEDSRVANTEVSVLASDVGRTISETNVTHVVSLIHDETKDRFSVTILPGALIDPSTIPWHDFKHGDIKSISEAKDLGFTHAKIVKNIPHISEVPGLSKEKA